MGTIDSRTPLPQEITVLITSKARQLVGRYRLTESDQQEIEQTIALEVVRRRSTVSQARAKHMGFLICLVNHAVADIIAARKAACRDYGREEASLDQWVQDEFGKWALRGETIPEQDARLHRGKPSIDPEELRDLIIDMSDAASRLSPRLREIFEQYAAQGSARKVAEATGRHHSSVCEAMQQIKRHFEKAGLEVYLPKPRRPNPTDSDTRR